VYVDVFDKWPVPSRDAASTDTTKIIRADYIKPIYAKIASEAIELWKTDLYKGTYHQTGCLIMCDELIRRMDPC
jgi:sarcosine oxidase / L-pipecolate oxidase